MIYFKINQSITYASYIQFDGLVAMKIIMDENFDIRVINFTAL